MPSSAAPLQGCAIRRNVASKAGIHRQSRGGRGQVQAKAQQSGKAVSLDGVTVAFHVAERGVFTAVERANLSVADGEFVAIVGPTGCGKSTLLNVAAGLLKPAAGSAKIF